MQAGQLPVDHDLAGLVGEDPAKAHPQAPGAPWIGVALIGLLVGIEPPDQAALEIEDAALRGGQRLQLMDELVGIHPAQGMIADPELACTIGDDHGVTQQIQNATVAKKLPCDSPYKLNPVENVWQFRRDNWLSNRIFKSYDDILDQCCFAWNRLTDQPWRIMSIGLRDWAHR